MPASYLVPALEQESPTIQHYNTGPCNWQNQCLQCFKHKPQRAACHKYQQSAEAGLQGSTFNSSVGSANVAVFHILPQQNQHQPPFTAAKPVRSRLASSCKLEHQAKHRRSHSANLIMTTFEPPPPPPPPPPPARPPTHTHTYTPYCTRGCCRCRKATGGTRCQTWPGACNRRPGRHERLPRATPGSDGERRDGGGCGREGLVLCEFTRKAVRTRIDTLCNLDELLALRGSVPLVRSTTPTRITTRLVCPPS